MERRKPTRGTHHAAENPALNSEASGSLREDISGLSWDSARRSCQKLRRESKSSKRRPATTSSSRWRPSRRASGRKALETLAGVVGKRAAASITALEPRLLAWLEEHRDHPAQFISDPLSCLERLGLEQDDDLSELSRRRSTQLRTLDLASLEEVHSITVRSTNEEEEKER